MKRRKNRAQKREENKQFLLKKLSGKGLYIYRNNTKGTLMLPKSSADGKKEIPANGTFRGDDYFMQYVKSHELILVEVLERSNETMEKLILDQPDTVTERGKVEHVTPPEGKKLNEVPEEEKQKEVLINDECLDGVEIILD